MNWSWCIAIVVLYGCWVTVQVESMNATHIGPTIARNASSVPSPRDDSPNSEDYKDDDDEGEIELRSSRGRIKKLFRTTTPQAAPWMTQKPNETTTRRTGFLAKFTTTRRPRRPFKNKMTTTKNPFGGYGRSNSSTSNIGLWQNIPTPINHSNQPPFHSNPSPSQWNNPYAPTPLPPKYVYTPNLMPHNQSELLPFSSFVFDL